MKKNQNQKVFEKNVGDFIYEVGYDRLVARRITRVTNKAYFFEGKYGQWRIDKGRVSYRYFPTQQQAEDTLKKNWREEIEEAKMTIGACESFLKEKIRVERDEETNRVSNAA